MQEALISWGSCFLPPMPNDIRLIMTNNPEQKGDHLLISVGSLLEIVLYIFCQITNEREPMRRFSGGRVAEVAPIRVGAAGLQVFQIVL